MSIKICDSLDTRRRLRWRTRQAASPLSGCARKRRDKHTPFLNFGKINRQRAKICADPLANSSPFLCLHIFCSFVIHINDDFRSCLSLAFRLFLNGLKSSFATVACACLRYKCARACMREKKRSNSCIQVVLWNTFNVWILLQLAPWRVLVFDTRMRAYAYTWGNTVS